MLESSLQVAKEYSEIFEAGLPLRILECKEKKSNTQEYKEIVQMLKNPDVKNANKSKTRLTLVKLERKKQDKKVVSKQESSGGKFPSNDRKKPRPVYY